MGSLTDFLVERVEAIHVEYETLLGMTLSKSYSPPFTDIAFYYLSHIKGNIIQVPLFPREGFRVSWIICHIELIPRPLLLRREGGYKSLSSQERDLG